MRRRGFVKSAIVAVGGLVSGCIGDEEDSDGNESEVGEGGEGNKTEEDTDEDKGGEDEGDEDEPRDIRPYLVGTDFEILDTESGTRGDEVSVRFNEDSLTVSTEGTIFGNSSCYIAELDDATYDEEDGVLSLSIVTFDSSGKDEFCLDVITEIEYRVDASFESSLPEKVVVEHDGERIAEARGSLRNETYTSTVGVTNNSAKEEENSTTRED